MMTSLLSPDCPKKMEKKRNLWLQQFTEKCLHVWEILILLPSAARSCKSLPGDNELPPPLVSSTQHAFSSNLGGLINVSQCDFVRGASHMFHCGDAATSWSLWFTFGDTNRISLRMWQKLGLELLGWCRQSMDRVSWQQERGTRGCRHSRLARFLWDPALLEETPLSSHLHLGLWQVSSSHPRVVTAK